MYDLLNNVVHHDNIELYRNEIYGHYNLRLFIESKSLEVVKWEVFFRSKYVRFSINLGLIQKWVYFIIKCIATCQM